MDDPRQRNSDISKAKSVLNCVPLEEGLAMTIAYFSRIVGEI